MPTTLALYQLYLISICFLQDETTADFSELGSKLLGGFVLAVVVAVTYAFVKLRWRDKNPPAQFISISPNERKDEPAKVARD
ncbi:MAG: hypothetical protein QOF62_538 [Pyrinomonadaceae bacterium]|jgi:hypothetical protein|nr:hypothetical protein [Pyrinomonadaceae bacterium]